MLLVCSNLLDKSKNVSWYNFLESNLAIQIKFDVISITYNSISATPTYM